MMLILRMLPSRKAKHKHLKAKWRYRMCLQRWETKELFLKNCFFLFKKLTSEGKTVKGLYHSISDFSSLANIAPIFLLKFLDGFFFFKPHSC